MMFQPPQPIDNPVGGAVCVVGVGIIIEEVRP